MLVVAPGAPSIVISPSTQLQQQLQQQHATSQSPLTQSSTASDKDLLAVTGFGDDSSSNCDSVDQHADDDTSEQPGSDADSDSCSSTITVDRDFKPHGLHAVDVPSAASESRQTPKKRVTFVSSRDTVHRIPHREEYAPDEIGNSYYDKSEYQEMRRECYMTIVRARNRTIDGVDSEPVSTGASETTLRGLEGLFPSTYERRMQRVRRSQQAVFHMQIVHEGQTTSSSAQAFIAQVYQTTTTTAVKLARQRALVDQQAVSVVGERGIPPRRQVIFR